MVSVQISPPDNRLQSTLAGPKFYSRATNSNNQRSAAHLKGISYPFFRVLKSCLWTFGSPPCREMGQLPGLSKQNTSIRSRKMHNYSLSGIRTDVSHI